MSGGRYRAGARHCHALERFAGPITAETKVLMDRCSAWLGCSLLIALGSGCSKESAPAPEVHAAVPASAATRPPAQAPERAPEVPLPPVPARASEVRLQRGEPINAAPLGLEIGYANLAGAT